MKDDDIEELKEELARLQQKEKGMTKTIKKLKEKKREELYIQEEEANGMFIVDKNDSSF